MVNDVLLPFASAMERRLTLRLLAYWEKLRAGQPMPSEQDFNPDDISDLWDSCFLVHTARFPDPAYDYSYIGSEITKAWQGALGAGDAKSLISPHISDISAIYAQICQSARPVVDEGEFLNLSQRMVRFRRCFLPLGENGTVSAIFGGMRFKVF